MNQTVWLASYPKSGNTWVRLLIGGLALAEGEPFELNTALQRDGNANMRAILDHLSLIETDLLTHDEVDELRPDVYADMARNPAALDDLRDEAGPRFPIRFVKTHDAYAINRSGRPLLGGAEAASAAVVVVRDPRDIAPSLASHLGESIDAAIRRMGDDRDVINLNPDWRRRRVPQRLLDWSGNVASWLDQRDLPVHLVRYEDLKRDAVAALHSTLAAVGLPVTRQDVARSASLCAFDRLQAQEREGGFDEAPSSGALFFRRGEAGGWRHELTADQVRRIEAAHGPMMQRLGYELAERRS